MWGPWPKTQYKKERKTMYKKEKEKERKQTDPHAIKKLETVMKHKHLEAVSKVQIYTKERYCVPEEKKKKKSLYNPKLFIHI